MGYTVVQAIGEHGVISDEVSSGVDAVQVRRTAVRVPDGVAQGQRTLDGGAHNAPDPCGGDRVFRVFWAQGRWATER